MLVLALLSVLMMLVQRSHHFLQAHPRPYSPSQA